MTAKKDQKKILVAVAWPYVNGPMHIGHLAGCYIAADIFAKYHRLAGNRVLMVSGSDMHGTPTAVLAEREGVKPIEIANKYDAMWRETYDSIDMSFDLYTKTSTENHKEVSQKLFLTLLEKGYIFKGKMIQAYCEHDKRFLPDRFVEGTCPFCGYKGARGDQCDNCGRTLDPKDLIDPWCRLCKNPPIEKETEHFFFDLPKFSKRLEEFLSSKKDWRTNTREFSLSWIREGLKATAITRDMDYGIPVPVKGYEDKVIYVWFEAVIGYLSASIEWAKDYGESWEEFWRDPKNSFHYYFMGKDNISFHTIRWPAMLMAYDETLNLPYNVVANQYLNLRDGKFSKSTGNFIQADYLIQNYGSDQVRFYISAFMPETNDSDFSWEAFITFINSEMVGNLGNLVNRAVVFIEKNFESKVPKGKLDKEVKEKIDLAFKEVGGNLEKVKFQAATSKLLALSKFGNKYFDENKPWASDKESSGNTLYNTIQILSALSTLLKPFAPKGSKKIEEVLSLSNNEWEFKEIDPGTEIKNPGLLYGKIDEKKIAEEVEKLGD